MYKRQALNSAITEAKNAAPSTDDEVKIAVDKLDKDLNSFKGMIKNGHKVTVKGVTVSLEKVTLEAGKSQKLTATVETDGNDKSVTWKSDKDSVATVDEKEMCIRDRNVCASLRKKRLF